MTTSNCSWSHANILSRFADTSPSTDGKYLKGGFPTLWSASLLPTHPDWFPVALVIALLLVTGYDSVEPSELSDLWLEWRRGLGIPSPTAGHTCRPTMGLYRL